MVVALTGGKTDGGQGEPEKARKVKEKPGKAMGVFFQLSLGAPMSAWVLLGLPAAIYDMFISSNSLSHTPRLCF